MKTPGAYGGTSHLFLDWVSATNTLRSGPKKATVISLIQSHLIDTLSIHLFLSQQTGGVCLRIPDGFRADPISKLTVSVLLTWMGVEKITSGGDTSQKPETLALVKHYKDLTKIDLVKSEADDSCMAYFVKKDTKEFCERVQQNVESTDLNLDNMKALIPRRPQPMMEFSKRYAADGAYRELVIEQLGQIICLNVSAITVNPVFGSLWRTVSKDRTNASRDRLIAQFGAQVERITDPGKKEKMKAWLEESYDYAGEVAAMIEAVPEKERYPCVFLDPTVDFPDLAADADEALKGAKTLTRAELLEIGRSCDPRILRRLGRILARLTYAATEADLPAHIKVASEVEVPRIPMVLASARYDRKFWKVILHAILPGTMLAPRPAALLAALSLRMGIKPLQAVADAELLAFQTWNSLEIPETWNTSCLSLLLEADKNYRGRNISKSSEPGASASLLSDGDRRLFETLVQYKLLELNLDTALTAKIGWNPNKTRVSLGPVAICKSCQYPRSVTIMSLEGICGICNREVTTYLTEEERDSCISANVTAQDDKETPATWVECSISSCRAQYVVYNVENLNVRPKCFYCRQDSAMSKKDPRRELFTVAPCVTCSRCLSRVIWPKAYRPPDFSEAEFECPACEEGRVGTIVEHETTARKLVYHEQNGLKLLLRNDGNKIRDPFNGRSLFHTITTAKVEGFTEQVEVFPLNAAKTPPTIGGKLVRNFDSVLDSLKGWVESRQVESGSCSLCFGDFKKAELRAACGRRGCHQQICRTCQDSWYSINSPGKILNVAALSCPFCRRQPAAQVLPTGLRSLKDLKRAVDDAGTWIYAWCCTCGTARQLVQRVCADGAPPELEHWSCAGCQAGDRVSNQPLKKVNECPGCGVLTEKIHGCDHIHCPQCNSHWCFACGEEFSADTIYGHMSQEHGGWFNGAEYDEDEDEDEDGYELDL